MSDNNEKILTPKEKREVIRRTLKAVDKADKGYIARDTIKYCVDLSGNILTVFLSALVIDGIAGAKPVDTLFIYAAIVVGVQALLSVVQRFLFRRNDSHSFKKTTNMQKNLWQKVMTMDYVHLESTDMQNKYANAWRQPENRTAGIEALCNYFKNTVGGVFMVALGVILISPTVFRMPTETDGFIGFIQSIWGFITVAIIVTALELIKSLVINPKAIVGFEKIHNDKNVIMADRAGNFFNHYVRRSGQKTI